MLQVSRQIAIPEAELEEEFMLASGPGGQNVNKVSSAVKLRFAAVASPSLPEAVKARLLRLAGKRVTRSGEIIIDARQFRDRERNRAAARDRLLRLLQEALIIPKVRRPTRPTRASRERRLDGKRQRSTVKGQRRPASEE